MASDTTVVAVDVPDVDATSKTVAIEATATSSPPPPHRASKRGDSNTKLSAHGAKRGRVSTDTALASPALTITATTAGSPTTAAPIPVSIFTATALAVADPKTNMLNEPTEALDHGDHNGATVNEAAASASRAAAAVTASGSAGPEVVVGPGSLRSASGAIAGVATASPPGLAPATASATAAAAAHHAGALGSGSESATIVANPTSRVRAGCPPTPVISRLPVPRSHAIASSTVPTVPLADIGSQRIALHIGLRSSAAPTPATAPARIPSAPSTPATAPMALGHFPLVGGFVRKLPPVVQRGMSSIRSALVALFRPDMESTTGHEDGVRNVYNGAELAGRETHGDQERGDGWWDEDAHIDAALLELSKRQRRRFL